MGLPRGCRKRWGLLRICFEDNAGACLLRPIRACLLLGACGAGLAARGLGTTGGEAPFRLAVAMQRFNAPLTDRAGRALWADRSRTELSEPTLASGILADPKDLQALLNRALNQAVDKVLDNPGFRSALAR